MHRVNSSHQDGKSSASCMLGARNRYDLPKLPFGRCFQIEPRWELTWLKVSNYGITWNASWGCLAWGRTVLLASSKSLGSYVRAAQQNHGDHSWADLKFWTATPNHIPCSPISIKSLIVWESDSSWAAHVSTWRSFFWVSLWFLPSKQYVAIEFPWVKCNDSNYPDWMMPWCFMHCILGWTAFIRLLQKSVYSMDFASFESSLSVHSRTGCGPFQWSSPFEPATIHSKLPGAFPSTLVDRHNVDAFQGKSPPFNSLKKWPYIFQLGVLMLAASCSLHPDFWMLSSLLPA